MYKYRIRVCMATFNENLKCLKYSKHSDKDSTPRNKVIRY